MLLDLEKCHICCVLAKRYNPTNYMGREMSDDQHFHGRTLQETLRFSLQSGQEIWWHQTK
jgi:hypothetical protein